MGHKVLFPAWWHGLLSLPLSSPPSCQQFHYLKESQENRAEEALCHAGCTQAARWSCPRATFPGGRWLSSLHLCPGPQASSLCPSRLHSAPAGAARPSCGQAPSRASSTQAGLGWHCLPCPHSPPGTPRSRATPSEGSVGDGAAPAGKLGSQSVKPPSGEAPRCFVDVRNAQNLSAYGDNLQCR